jgi:uncharacterized protein (TIRG00374 family)
LNKKIKKSIFILLPVILGVILIWYSVSQFTPEDIQSIQTSFETANYWWVLLSVIFGALSHLSRAYRWQFLLEPLGYKPKFANSIMAVLIAYFLNLFIPRSGEIARAASIKKYENIPFEKAFGTIVAERVADVLMLFSIIGIAFLLQTKLIGDYLFKEDEGGNPWLKILILLVLSIGGYLGYRKLKNSKNPIVTKIISFVKGLLDGVKSITHMKKKWQFISHTLFIWLMYVLMFYAATFALPETTNLPFAAIIVGFVVGGLSMAMTNGGLGTYPVFVASALILYNIENNPARAFGWIMWTAQTAMVILFGGFSFLLIPIYNRAK